MKPPNPKSLDGLKQIRPQRTSFFSQEESKKIRIPKLKQIANLPKTLALWERILLFILAGIVLISVGFWIQIYYFQHSHLVPTSGGEYTEGMVGQPKYINPLLAQTNDIDMDLSYLVFSGLVKYNAQQELTLDLAEKYELSEDKKEYTFFLKPNLRWQDDEPLTSDDVIFTVHRILDPEFKSPLRSAFLGVSLEKIDEQTVKFILKEPYLPFLSQLTVGILPMHIWETIPPANALLAEYNLKPVGSGPWQFYKLKKDREGKITAYTLRPNPYYYGESPYLEKINFFFYSDSESLIQDLNARKIDGINYIAKEKQQNLATNDNLKIYTLELPHSYSIFLNQNQNDLLKEKYIREAIEYATPKQKIIDEAMFGNGQVLYSPLLLSNTEQTGARVFDPAQVEAILKSHGWTKGEDGIYAKDKKRLSFKLVTTDWPEYLATAEILKTTYHEAGIELVTEAYSATQVQQEFIRPRNFQALLYGEIFAHDPDPYIFWHSSQTKDPGLNLACFQNEEADKILEEIRGLTLTERFEKYQKLEEIVAQEVPVIPLYAPYYSFGVNKKIKGIESSQAVYPHERFAALAHWYIEQKRQWAAPEKGS